MSARRRRLSEREYVDGVLAGDRAILAQAITLVESSRREDADLAETILEACLPRSGDSTRVGITGVPGVGKSRLIEVLGTYLTHQRSEKVAVLAIDPSSQVSHGSILGDKTRMQMLANDQHAFIRPSASGGSLGGVARRTREAMLLCEAAGFGNIIVETVGVGQSETAVRSMVDFFLLLMLAGAGDELQGMKRGIMEIADLIAITKADGENQRRAEAAAREYEGALRLFPPPSSGWETRVVTCSAVTGEGIPALWDVVLEHRRYMQRNGCLQHVRKEQAKSWMHEMIDYELAARFRSHPAIRGALPEYERDVVEGRISSFRAARRLLDKYET